MSPGGSRWRRIGAYGICRDEAGRVLLVPASPGDEVPGRWRLPGGGVQHGEHPMAAVVRETGEETGYRVEVGRLYDAVADLVPGPDATVVHHDRLLFEVTVRGGQRRAERTGSGDGARWFTRDELAGLPLMPYAARALGRPVRPGADHTGGAGEAGGAGDAGGAPAAEPVARAAALPADAAPVDGPLPPRRQRFGAYGLVTDPAGRVLLTLIAPGYPGSGRWHLPGGGTDFGELPADCVLRELAEESGQLGRVIGLIGMSSGHFPAAVGPEGRPVDWHTVRVHYRVAVEVPRTVRVTEAAGGSTAEAAWFTPARLAALRLTDVAASVVRDQLG